MMQSNEEITDNEIFTFDDWLSYRVFYHVEDGVQLCNDSRNFTKLFHRGCMSNDTFKKIREEQSIVYKGIVNQKLELRKTLFRVTYIRESNVPLEYLRISIEDVEHELTVEHKKFYSDFVSGNKCGQGFISPTDYYHYHKIEVGRREVRPDSYDGLIKKYDKECVFFVNMWVEIEATYYFLEWLKELQSGKFSLGFSDENRVVELSTPAPKEIGKEIKDILKANDKDRRIGNRFDELMITHKDKKTVLAIMGRQIDLEVGTETSTEKNKTDSIKRTLRGYGIIK